MRVPVVTIDRDGVAVRINESDFDPKEHKLFKGEAVSSDEEADNAHKGGEVEVRHLGAGWYDVLVNGKAINESKLRKEAAHDLAGSQ